MNYDAEFNRLLRHEKKLQYLDADEPRCNICGIDDPVVLERHHLAGRANSGMTVWLCRNHHAAASDRQQDLQPDLRSEDIDRDPLLKQAATLQGIAILLIIAAIMLFAWSRWNVQASAQLIAPYGPDWHNAISVESPQ